MKQTWILLLCLTGASIVSAAPSLTTGELAAYQNVCNGMPPSELPASTGTRLLVLDKAGIATDIQDSLPADIAAGQVSEIGALLCLAEQITEEGQCAFNIFLSVPRIRHDLELNVIALNRGAVFPGELSGTAPPACEQAGKLASDEQLEGALPSGAAVVQWLNANQLGTADTDQDSYSGFEEFVLTGDPADPLSPGATAQLLVNPGSQQVLADNLPIRVALSFRPAQYLKQPAQYYLYAQGNGVTWSYLHPGGMRSGDQPVVAVSAKAVSLDALELSVLKGLPAGSYTLTFAVEVNDRIVSESTTEIAISTSNWHFTDVTEQAGFDYRHGYSVIARESERDLQVIAGGGVAAGDFDRDGWTDLYVTRGTIGPNLLFRNLGDGRFVEMGQEAGVAITGNYAGTTFADYDGDGWLDLIVGAFSGDQLKLFHNQRDGTFTDQTQAAGFPAMKQSFGASFADIDNDGDLDLWLNHWFAAFNSSYLWRNNGDGTFSDISLAAGIENSLMADFTTNFADINNDGWPDAVVTGDYGSSQIFINQGNGHFRVSTNAVISDENGMGAAVADYDNDGDLDWFVSSIHDFAAQSGFDTGVPFGSSGNRLYQNQGDGTFADVTETSGTRIGSWGWGSCFADFNNDTRLDIFHVNGYSGGGHSTVAAFEQDYSVMFIADETGRFKSQAFDLGLVDDRQGRGIVCFDYDQDGDIDLFIANNEQAPRLYRNDGGNAGNYLQVQLTGQALNTQAIGARIYVTTGAVVQMRELQAGSNYMSQNPVVAHFGLGAYDIVDEVRIEWPSGDVRILEDVAVNRALWISAPPGP